MNGTELNGTELNGIEQVQVIVDEKLKSKKNKTGDLDYDVNKICNYNKDKILKIFEKFSKQVYPIYGFQKDSFLKLLNKGDRTTFILEVDGKEIGVLAFKDKLQKEDNVINSEKGYIEIKSFFLFDGFGKGNIWFLWNEFIKYIKENYNDTDGSYVTISKTKANPSLEMLKKIGFQELYSVHNEYSDDNSLETHLYLPLNKKQEKSKITLPIKKEYFDLIKQGTKTVEGRSGKSYANIKIGDIIKFKNGNNILNKKVKDIVRYSSIEDFLENEGIENVLPGITDINQAINIYKNIPGYNKKINNFGIIAFKI